MKYAIFALFLALPVAAQDAGQQKESDSGVQLRDAMVVVIQKAYACGFIDGVFHTELRLNAPQALIDQLAEMSAKACKGIHSAIQDRETPKDIDRKLKENQN